MGGAAVEPYLPSDDLVALDAGAEVALQFEDDLVANPVGGRERAGLALPCECGIFRHDFSLR